MISAVIIDDDKNITDVFSEYLTLEGIEVIGKGYDGKDAVDLYAKLNPDVMFLDVMMERFDGLYALEEIRKINTDANVIMITADLTENTYKKMTSLKASAIIFKPYEIDALRKIIKNLVQVTQKI